MASSGEDKNFNNCLDDTCSPGRSKAQMSFGKILGTISAASAQLNSPQTQPHRYGGEEVEGEIFVAEKVEKRGLLDIDLNVAPPEDDGSESPAAKKGGNGLKIKGTAVAAVASNVYEEKVSSADEHKLNFDSENSGNRTAIEAHWSKGKANGFDVVDEETEEKERRNRRWNVLLEVAENTSRKYEENIRNKEEKVQNRKSGTRREAELGSERHRGTTRKKLTRNRRQSFAEWWNDDREVVAPPVVVRSTRGRAVAMPNKYRDSVIDAASEAEFTRRKKSGKSASVVSTKRKSR